MEYIAPECDCRCGYKTNSTKSCEIEDCPNFKARERKCAEIELKAAINKELKKFLIRVFGGEDYETYVNDNKEEIEYWRRGGFYI